MEHLLNIACRSVGDFAVWVCQHCESNVMGGSVCDVCDQVRWSTPRPRPASVAVFVDLWGDDPVPMQVPLPYMVWDEVPENYSELMDSEREEPIQLRMRLN